MKKLFILLAIALLVSCTASYSDSEVGDKYAKTTVRIQQSVIDSCATIATDGKYVYVMKDNLVAYKLAPMDSEHIVVHEVMVFVFVMLIAVVIIFILAINKAIR